MIRTLLGIPLAAALLSAPFAARTAGAQTADPASPTAPAEVQPKTTAPLGAGQSGSLSDQLDRSNGVIKPPAAAANTDPGMVKPAPDTGTTTTMPVVPPPGTPENAPNVQPK